MQKIQSKSTFSQEAKSGFSGVYIKKISLISLAEGDNYPVKSDSLAFIESGNGSISSGADYSSDQLVVLTGGEKLSPAVDTRLYLVEIANGEGFLTALGRAPTADDFQSQLLFCKELMENLPRWQDIFLHSAFVYTHIMELLSQQSTSGGTTPLVESAVDIIRREYAFLGGVNEVADQLAVSVHHLTRQFSRQLGVSPGKYLEKIRLDRAALLLRHSDYDLTMIANMVGYSGGNYFGKVFRRSMGKTPLEYKKSFGKTTISPEERSFLKELEGQFFV